MILTELGRRGPALLPIFSFCAVIFATAGCSAPAVGQVSKDLQFVFILDDDTEEGMRRWRAACECVAQSAEARLGELRFQEFAKLVEEHAAHAKSAATDNEDGLLGAFEAAASRGSSSADGLGESLGTVVPSDRLRVLLSLIVTQISDCEEREGARLEYLSGS